MAVELHDLPITELGSDTGGSIRGPAEHIAKEQRFTVRYLAVYVKTGAQWRMIAWQSTRVPDAQ